MATDLQVTDIQRNHFPGTLVALTNAKEENSRVEIDL
jgi:hypothetical protein